MTKAAIYAGSFDPPTNGHLWMIEQGIKMFDHLTIAIGTNPSKKSTYPLETRCKWLKAMTKNYSNSNVVVFENSFLVHFASKIQANFILRGMRNVNDYTYEQSMRHINNDLCPDISTVFLIPPRDLIEVSSSTVRGMIGPEGWENIVSKLLPKEVFEDVRQIHAESVV